MNANLLDFKITEPMATPAPKEPEFKYSADQINALDMFDEFLKSPKKRFFSLVGPAGTGKSTIVKAMIKQAAKHGEINLSAPTHKAAQNLRNITLSPAGTIHSLLLAIMKRDFKTGEQKIEFDEERFNIWDFENTITFVDESSMLGDTLLKRCGKIAMGVGCKFVFIGDRHQLSPVGEDDSIAVDPEKCTWDYAELTTVHRQAADNPVLALATSIRQGGTNLVNIPAHDVEGVGVFVLPNAEWRERLIDQCKDIEMKNHGVSYSNDFADKVNTVVRKAANGNVDDIPPYLPDELMLSNTRIAFGDQVFAQNNEEVKILEVNPINEDMFGEATEYELGFLSPEREMVTCRAMKSFNDRKAYFDNYAKKVKQGKATWKAFYKESDIVSDLRPIHCGTVHKSQGSTYNDTYINLTELAVCYDPIEHRRLLYVAITRASGSVYLTH